MKNMKLLLIWLFNSLVLLLILEIILRVFFPYEPNENDEVAGYRNHPVYLVGLEPNIEKRYIRLEENGGDTIYWKTNDQAFRGEKLVQKDIRIMIYGDSNIQARFSDLSNTYPRQLQKLIGATFDRSVEVINAGVVGFGPDQSLLKFMKEKDVFKPDLVILQIFADNDFGDIVRNRLFKIDSSGTLARSYHKNYQDPALKRFYRGSKPWEYLRILDGVKKIQRLVRSKNDTITAEKMIAVCSMLCVEEYKTYIGESSKIHSHFADHYDIDVATNPDSEISKKKILLMEKVLAKFGEVAKQNDIELLVLIEPSIVDLTTNFSMNHNDLRNRFPNYDAKNLSRFIENACIKEQIKYINLYEDFLKDSPNQLYFASRNDHWNDLGQKKAAEITADYLRENYSYQQGLK